MIEIHTLVTEMVVQNFKEKTIYFRSSSNYDSFKVYYIKEDGRTFKVAFREKTYLMEEIYSPNTIRVDDKEKQRIVDTYFSEIRMEGIL